MNNNWDAEHQQWKWKVTRTPLRLLQTSSLMDKPKALISQTRKKHMLGFLNTHRNMQMKRLGLKLHVHARTHTLQESVFRSFSSSFLHPLTPSPISSPKRLQASGCKQLQSTGVKWTSRQARVDSQHADLKEAKHSQLRHEGTWNSTSPEDL